MGHPVVVERPANSNSRKNLATAQSLAECAILTKWMMPAAVSHVETNMALICASRMEVEVLRMLRYCRMSGRVMRRRARRKRRPAMIYCAHWT